MQPLKTSLPIAFLAAMAALSHASAEDYYVEGTAGVSSFGFSDRLEEEHTTLGARFGRNFNANLAIEGELAVGVSEESRTQTGFDPLGEQSLTLITNENLNAAFGVFGKAMWPLADRFTAHARLGYANTEFETENQFTVGDGTTRTSDFKRDYRGFAYGLGTEFNFTDKLYARADATRYDASDDAVDSYTLCVGFRF